MGCGPWLLCLVLALGGGHNNGDNRLLVVVVVVVLWQWLFCVLLCTWHACRVNNNNRGGSSSRVGDGGDGGRVNTHVHCFTEKKKKKKKKKGWMGAEIGRGEIGGKGGGCGWSKSKVVGLLGWLVGGCLKWV